MEHVTFLRYLRRLDWGMWMSKIVSDLRGIVLENDIIPMNLFLRKWQRCLGTDIEEW